MMTFTDCSLKNFVYCGWKVIHPRTYDQPKLGVMGEKK